MLLYEKFLHNIANKTYNFAPILSDYSVILSTIFFQLLINMSLFRLSLILVTFLSCHWALLGNGKSIPYGRKLRQQKSGKSVLKCFSPKIWLLIVLISRITICHDDSWDVFWKHFKHVTKCRLFCVILL